MNVDLRNSTRTSVADAGSGAVAPFAVLRAATLPFDALEALRIPETETLLARVISAANTMEGMRERTEAILHGLVPDLRDDKALRRRVVNLKRDVHNGRGDRLDDPALAAIASLVADADARRDLDTWSDAARDHGDATAALPETVAREMQEVVRPALRATLDVPHFARAVALANPRTARSAAREKRLPRTAWPDKLERSLLGYIARAAAKTSPFSSFMSVSTLPVDAGRTTAIPMAPVADFDSIASANRGLAAQFDGLSREAVLRASGAPFAVTSTLRPVRNGRHVALCTTDVTLAGRGWSEQRLAQFRLGARLGEVLVPGTRAGWSDWVKRLTEAGVPGAEADGLVATLLDRGVLVAPAVTDAYLSAPLCRLAGHWRASGAPDLAAAADDLDEIDAQLDGFASSAGAYRLARIARADEGVARLRERFAAKMRPTGELTNAITEDCMLGSARGTLGHDLLEPLGDLQDFLSTQVAIAPAYAALVEAFVETFGAGGTCDGITEFLTGAAPRLVDIPEFGARIRESAPCAAPEGVRIPVTAHFQIARRADGSAQFVMNRVFDGAGWLAARFTRSDHPQADRLASALGGWLPTVAGGAEPVDLPIAGHASDLQAHRDLTRRVLGWPGEPLTIDPSRILDPATLRLAHDAETNLLTLADASGREISLQYLGNTFPNPSWGVRYALSILSRPFAVARPAVESPEPGGSDPVHLRPARRHGRVVLSRAAYWVRSDHLRATWLRGGPAERLLATATAIRELGLPPRFYAQGHVPMRNASLVANDMLDANRKPIFVDSRNPFWLDMVERLTRRAEWIVLTPPDPGPDELWFEVAGRRHVTEIHLEMLVRAGRRHRNSA